MEEAGFFYKSEEHFEARNLAYNTAIDFVAAGMPQKPDVKKAILDSIKGHLSAWDPIQQKEIWRVDRTSPVNGGILSTAGNLLFEGTAQGNMEAYRADKGEKLWSAEAQSGVVAAPVTYTVGKEQYVAVVVGWGGAFPLATGEIALKVGRPQNISRVLAFKLGGKRELAAIAASLATTVEAAAIDGQRRNRAKRRSALSKLLLHLPWRCRRKRRCFAGLALFRHAGEFGMDRRGARRFADSLSAWFLFQKSFRKKMLKPSAPT